MAVTMGFHITLHRHEMKLYDAEGSNAIPSFYSSFSMLPIVPFPSITRPRVIVDLGANVGGFSFLLALANPEATVYAYEPVPINYEHLLLGIRSNNLYNVVPINKAASLKEEVEIYFDEKSTDASSQIIWDHRKEDELIKIVCKGVSLKEILLPFSHVDLLKIDIETEEYNLSTDWEELDKVGALFIEFHATDADSYRDIVKKDL